GHGPARAGEVVNEIGQIRVCRCVGGSVRLVIEEADRPPRIEWNEIVHLEVINVAPEFKRVAAHRIAECFLELVRLVTTPLWGTQWYAKRWQVRLAVKTDRWGISERARSGRRCFTKGETNI